MAGGSHKAAAAGASTAVGSAGSSINIATTDFSVKSAPGGTVAVTLNNPKGMSGLETALRQAGIPAAVLEFSASCHTKVDTDDSVDIEKVFPQSTNGRVALIRPSAIPAGDSVLFGEMMTPVGGLAPSLMSVVRQFPGCLPASDNPVGAGDVAAGTNP